ncbi:hypothetical protein COCSADRAFT_216202 [Bipolaris sorokiniana ND90Pr]|uniref:ISWI chromatin-remodeling complex ATPase ISW2 n=1 Tax=Cochliobolus sativus (strain ND90Pr / ATCC 201652) TaxID=665912 RepID=M2TMS9_COCSN|nr:uncharacterized protein COCSADRAFT_216202 [Bipolaris sorokiniana ND90Pr]EMD70017.1 hypothetical protein COCSADRAFT_216202 [Bipolaris sorokiniana ND90Pr]
MGRQSVVTLGSPQSITPPPKRRGGQLQDLLVQFGSQSSVESATKNRRLSAQQKSEEMKPIPIRDSRGKRNPPPQTAQHDVTSDSSAGEQSPVTSTRITRQSASKPTDPDPEDSEDELAPSARPRKTSARISAYTEELKMEKRKREKERTDGLRRGTRDRRSAILESDTITITTSSRRRKSAPPPRKLDTARNRLRDDIAKGTRARANSFLVANKDFFLPLLPKNNHVAKLVEEGKAQPIIEYQELKEQPKGVTAVMKPYQLSGLSFLVHLYNNGFSGILGDEMGLGKTLQTLSLFQYLEELDEQKGIVSEEPRPYLVVCPLSVLNSWVTEAEKWVPQLGVMRFHGAVNERTRLKRVAAGLEDMKGNETSRARDRKALRKAGQKVSKLPGPSGSFKIVVTTYDVFQTEQAWFKHSFAWRYVVLDEGHKIKNSLAQISTALKSINAEYRLILTGTPLQNNMVEMWSLLTWLYPTVFDDRTEALFRESFDLSKGKANKQTMTDARRLLELIMLRRMKDSPSVNLGLPPKEEVLLYVPLTPMQKFWYTRLLTRIDDGMLNELFADGKEKEKAAIEHDVQENKVLQQLEDMDKVISTGSVGDEWEETAKIVQEAVAKEQTDANTSKGAWKKLMNLVMQLRKCCSHPYLLPGGAPDPYYLGDHVIRASGKFILLEKLLKHTIFEQGKKVLVFSGFARTLDCCEDLLSLVSNHGEKFKYLRLDGSTARARRNLDIRLFNQKDSDYKVMLLSTRAGGLGINLTSAQDVIFLDEDWNPQITLQAEARAHRIGQTKKVTIYKLCTQGTVEEQMMGRIRKKLYLSAKITESMQNVHGKQAVAKRSAGRPSIDEDMPQMDTSQLMTLVRRGAQTLSHPEIDVKEMVSWDLDTMIKKCRDQSAELTDTTQSEVDEDKWLSTMERVECAVFEGKRHQRNLDKSSSADTSSRNILPETITREDRRTNKNTTVMVNGYAISKESMNCGDWEAVPTFAGKDPRLAEPVREKRREFNHENHCLECFEDADAGKLFECKTCPRVYHFDCLDGHYQGKVKGPFSGFHCPQHNCTDCAKSTADAGGLIFRCRWCPRGYCEDCLDWHNTELIGENLPEFEVLGEHAMSGGFYVKCPSCIESAKEDPEQRAWIEEKEKTYKEEHAAWLQERETAQSVKIRDEDEASLPPGLTDTSLSTPVLDGSGAITPDGTETMLPIPTITKKRSQMFDETSDKKKKTKRGV